jgi:hypothetical protein
MSVIVTHLSGKAFNKLLSSNGYPRDRILETLFSMWKELFGAREGIEMVILETVSCMLTYNVPIDVVTTTESSNMNPEIIKN